MDYIVAGTTDVSLQFALSTGGLAATGFTVGCVRFDEGDGTSYAVIGPTALTALATITTAHTDNKGIYLDSDATGGMYFLFRVDVPDTYFASGKEKVIVSLYDDGNTVIAHRTFRLTRQPVNVEQVAGSTADIATETKQDIIDTNVDAILVDTGTTLPSSLSDISGLINTAQADLDIITGADGVNLLTATQASIDAIEVDTGEIGTAGAGLTDLGGMSTGMKAEVNTEADTALTDYNTTAMTEGYAAQGATMTPEQARYMIWSVIKSLKNVNTTTPDSLKIDDSTVAMSFLTDSATAPTEIKRTA